MQNNLTIPTHFRFLNKKEAKKWNRTINDWIPISEICIRENNDYHDISAASFAWVSYDVKKPNLKFKTKKFTKKDLKEFECD
jgi:hypothetical protein